MDAARLTIWDESACRRVHEATLEVLADTGIDVHYAPAVEIFAGAGNGVSLVTGALETSNVDLAREFTNLVVAQRAFQANSRVVTTADQVMQELVNLVR